MFRLQTAVTKYFETSEVRPRKIRATVPDESFVVLTAGGRRVQGWIKIREGEKSIHAASPVLLANPDIDRAIEQRREKAIRLSTLIPPTRQEMLWHSLFRKADNHSKTVVHHVPIHLIEGSRRLDEKTRKTAHFLQTLDFLPNERKIKRPDGTDVFIFERIPKSQMMLTVK